MSDCRHGGRDVYTRPNDMVRNPSHYTRGGIECKDAIKAALTEEEYRGWVKGNALAYIWRERFKNGQEDIEKAINMLGWLEPPTHEAVLDGGEYNEESIETA